jgi:hypothetical protein
MFFLHACYKCVTGHAKLADSAFLYLFLSSRIQQENTSKPLLVPLLLIAGRQPAWPAYLLGLFRPARHDNEHDGHKGILNVLPAHSAHSTHELTGQLMGEQAQETKPGGSEDKGCNLQ